MSEATRDPMTVDRLIELLSLFKGRDLLVVLDMKLEDTRSQIQTFIENPDLSARGRQQTYLGDKDILRIQFDQDEP
jgi:hypothetical protein